jgi:hypothetical protein
MKIKLKTNADGLNAVIQLIVKYNSFIEENKPKSLQGKMVHSIMADVLSYFMKQWQKAIENQNLFERKKQYSIVLKSHEAIALGTIITEVIEKVNEPLMKLKLNQIKDFINQKLI